MSIKKDIVKTTSTMKSKDFEKALQDSKADLEIPKDRYNVIFMVMFFLGLIHFVPIVFFINATEYWMYKFRNTTLNESMQNDADHRTVLQAQFASSSTVVSSVSLVLCTLFITFIGHRFKALVKIAGSITVVIVCFGVHITFIYMDTDSWQFKFFVIAIVIIAIVHGANTIFGMGMYDPMAKLPQIYLKSYLIGQSVATIFTNFLQIISLAVGGTVLQSALIYSIIGFSMLLLGLLSYLFIRKLDFYQYHMKHSLEAKSRKKVRPSLADIREILWICRYPFLTMFVFLLTMTSTYPSVANLVVSENKGNGNPWNDLYFVPVCSFFLTGVADFAGRTFSSVAKFHFSEAVKLILTVIRGILVVTFYLLSNAKPRSHLPVLLQHDYQYIIFVLCAGFTGGYIFNECFLAIRRLCPMEKIEMGYLLFAMCLSLEMMVFAFLGPVAVLAL